MSTLNVEKITASNGIVLPSYATGSYPVGTQGQVIFDSTTKEIKVFNGSTWDGLFPQYFADILIVGGGGGGGSSFGGGGGGGGVIYLRGYPLYKGQTFTVEVGAGGAGRPNETDTGIPADSGQRSGFGIHYAAGGGGGGGRGSGAAWGQPANPGGSGGGAGHSNSSPRGIPGEGIPGQGFMGGWGRQDVPNSHHAGGGGGGAAQTGGDHRDGISGGKGGNGIAYDISGSLVYYAGGGGGGVYTTMTGGAGGAGGGGEGGRYQSGQLTSGVSATGYGSGGGGGGYTYGGGNGSAGIVIIRYSGTQRGSGGSISTSGGYTRHTFTTTGSFTYTA